jgi:DNA-binding response OmpR family regulator
MKRILIIEDDLDMAEIVKLHLEELEYEVDIIADGEAGLKRALEQSYDLLILDLMLPGFNGLQICKKVRETNSDTSIIMLTRKSTDVDKVLGLELGADDYLTKPFSILELVARVKAHLRRVDNNSRKTTEQVQESISIGDLVIDPEKRRVLLKGEVLALTATEFELLTFLAVKPGRPFSRSELLEAIWEYNTSAYENTVSTHINRLRGKIEDDPASPSYILTVWGVGYRFAEPHELSKAA